MNRKNFASVVIGLVFFASMATAQVITIDPNNFANGQVINAPGVTLETETFVQTGPTSYVPTFFGPVYSVDIGASCSGVGCPPNGTSVFAPTSTGLLPLPNDADDGPGAFWGAPFGVDPVLCSQNCTDGVDAQENVLLRLDFAQPTNFVDALAFFNGGDPSQITAFDSAGNLIGRFENGVGAGSGFGWGYVTATSTRNMSMSLRHIC